MGVFKERLGATRNKSKKPKRLPLLTSPNIGRFPLMLTKPDKGLILASKHLQRARPVDPAPLWDHNKYDVINTELKLLPFLKRSRCHNFDTKLCFIVSRN